jgi:hypothetical protein
MFRTLSFSTSWIKTGQKISAILPLQEFEELLDEVGKFWQK